MLNATFILSRARAQTGGHERRDFDEAFLDERVRQLLASIRSQPGGAGRSLRQEGKDLAQFLDDVVAVLVAQLAVLENGFEQLGIDPGDALRGDPLRHLCLTQDLVFFPRHERGDLACRSFGERIGEVGG